MWWNFDQLFHVVLSIVFGYLFWCEMVAADTTLGEGRPELLAVSTPSSYSGGSSLCGQLQVWLTAVWAPGGLCWSCPRRFSPGCCRFRPEFYISLIPPWLKLFEMTKCVDTTCHMRLVELGRSPGWESPSVRMWAEQICPGPLTDWSWPLVGLKFQCLAGNLRLANLC